MSVKLKNKKFTQIGEKVTIATIRPSDNTLQWNLCRGGVYMMDLLQE